MIRHAGCVPQDHILLWICLTVVIPVLVGGVTIGGGMIRHAGCVPQDHILLWICLTVVIPVLVRG